MSVPGWLTAASLLLLCPFPAAAAPCPPLPGRTLAESRFPQTVRAGDLPGRDVLGPRENQAVLGRVQAVVARPDGVVELLVVRGGLLVRLGSALGTGTRAVAVPLTAATLLGTDMQLVGLTPDQLDAMPTYAGDTTPVGPDTVLCVGLSKPAH